MEFLFCQLDISGERSRFVSAHAIPHDNNLTSLRICSFVPKSTVGNQTSCQTTVVMMRVEGELCDSCHYGLLLNFCA